MTGCVNLRNAHSKANPAGNSRFWPLTHIRWWLWATLWHCSLPTILGASLLGTYLPSLKVGTCMHAGLLIGKLSSVLKAETENVCVICVCVVCGCVWIRERQTQRECMHAQTDHMHAPPPPPHTHTHTHSKRQSFTMSIQHGTVVKLALAKLACSSDDIIGLYWHHFLFFFSLLACYCAFHQIWSFKNAR